MTTPTTSATFAELWKSFARTLQKLIAIRLNRPVPFLEPFRAVIEETFRHLLSDKFVQELERAWTKLRSNPDHSLEARLLEMEMQAFQTGYQDVTGQASLDSADPPLRKEWVSQAHTAKEMAGVGRIILESIWSALQPLLPTWMDGLFRVLHEVVRMVT